jgi:NAD+ kinase
MSRFLLVPHSRREEAASLARTLINWLHERGHEVAILDEDARPIGLGKHAIGSLDHFTPDLAISLGGDGSMLRALDLMCPLQVPVTGVNVGHLGFLTEVEPEHVTRALERYLAGDYEIEERMTIEIVVTSAAEGDPTKSTISLSRSIAVNEVVVEKASGNTVRLAMTLNGEPFLTYAVDGMIVSTATGSTAYNLSARGPILSPTMQAILLTPVSPHMLFDRSIVLGGDETLELTVIGTRNAAVVVDGRHVATIAPGGAVRCRRSSRPARIVTFGGRDFHHVLKSKFGLADR